MPPKDAAKEPGKETPKGGAKEAPKGGTSQGGKESRYKIQNTKEEALKYDFKAARGPIKTTNVIESIGHLIKSCLGGGVVAIHRSYMRCGLLSALFLNVFFAFLVSYCMHILVKCAQVQYGRLKECKLSYPDLAEATLATCPFPRLRRYDKALRYAVDVTIGIDLFGSCCVYCVIMATSLSQILENSGAVTPANNVHIRYYIAGFLIPCILICMITELKYLAPFSIVADCFILTVAVSTIYYGLGAASKPILDFPIIKNVEGLVEYIGVVVFSMEGVGVSLPIENHMEEPKKFYLVLLGGMSIVATIVMIVGFFGYYGFGDLAESPVTMNFPFSGFAIVLKVFMVIMIYATFALNFWVPFELLWHYLKKEEGETQSRRRERIVRAIVVTIIVTIAVIFPNVNSFMALLGSFCLSNMGFIYPAFIQLIVEYEDPGLGFLKWRMLRFIALFSFGTALCILGTYFSCKNLIIESFK